MVQVSRDEFNRIARDQREKAAARKGKREEKRAALPWGWKKKQPCRLERRSKIQRTAKISQVSGRGALKVAIVRLLGLLDMKRNGKLCRFHRDHPGDTACHIVPQQRGDAARFDPENVYWGCSRANFGEVNNRSLYRQYHVDLFGRERVERLEALARTTRKFSTAELLELRAELKAELEKP